MKKKKIKRIKIIAENSLKKFLLRNNIYNKFINNEIRCEICNDIVNFENIGAFKIQNEKIIFICNKTLCVQKVNHE